MASVFIQFFLVLIFMYGVRWKKNNEDILERTNTDAIRYISCVVVVLSHIMYEGSYFVLGYFHFVCVTTFFMLSGYGIIMSMANSSTVFLRKHPYRIMKLLFPLVTVSIIEYLMKWNVGIGGLHWFNVLILFYLVIGFMFWIYKKINIVVAAMSFFVIMYAFFFQEIVSTKGVDLWWTSYFGWAQQATGFICGMVIALWKERITKFLERYQIILAIACSLILICSGLMYIRPHDISVVTNNQFWLRELISFSIIFLLLIFLLHVSIGNAITSWIGSKMSIHIFALHGLMINFAENELEILNEELKACFVIIGTFLVSGILSFLQIILHKKEQ